MAFEDIKQCIEWIEEPGSEEFVDAYFTAHFAGTVDDPEKDERDMVHYATGRFKQTQTVNAVFLTKKLLIGDLKTVFANTDVAKVLGGGITDGMVHKSNLSYRLEVHDDGVIGVQLKIAGHPVGGMPVQRLQGSSVSPGLLRAASTTTAYTVSLDRSRFGTAPK